MRDVEKELRESSPSNVIKLVDQLQNYAAKEAYLSSIKAHPQFHVPITIAVLRNLLAEEGFNEDEIENKLPISMIQQMAEHEYTSPQRPEKVKENVMFVEREQQSLEELTKASPSDSPAFVNPSRVIHHNMPTFASPTFVQPPPPQAFAMSPGFNYYNHVSQPQPYAPSDLLENGIHFDGHPSYSSGFPQMQFISAHLPPCTNCSHYNVLAAPANADKSAFREMGKAVFRGVSRALSRILDALTQETVEEYDLPTPPAMVFDPQTIVPNCGRLIPHRCLSDGEFYTLCQAERLPNFKLIYGNNSRLWDSQMKFVPTRINPQLDDVPESAAQLESLANEIVLPLIKHLTHRETIILRDELIKYFHSKQSGSRPSRSSFLSRLRDTDIGLYLGQKIAEWERFGRFRRSWLNRNDRIWKIWRQKMAAAARPASPHAIVPLNPATGRDVSDAPSWLLYTRS